MKKLIVAGCSFSTPSKSHPATHWSELLASQLDLQLTSFAREGCSNGGIRIAIDEIIQQRPELAIVVPTFPGRMEIPRDAAEYNWSKHKPSSGWAPPLEHHIENKLPPSGYNKDRGIYNLNLGQPDYNFISETIFSLAENFPNPYRDLLQPGTVEAIRHYISCLYDKNWKQQTDQWMIAQGITQLWDHGINFIVLPCLLWKQSSVFDDIASGIPKSRVGTNETCPLQATNKYPLNDHTQDPGYHGSTQSQIYLAEQLEDHIVKHKFL